MNQGQAHVQLIDPLARRWPLHGASASRSIEHSAQADLPPHTLMQRAGVAVARLALAIAPHAERFWVAAGPGNNGGDGLEAAAWLLSTGKAVSVCLHADAARLPADASAALQRAKAAGVPIALESPQDLGRHDLAIDALLGLGARSSSSATLSATIEALNHLPCPVLAVDLPSGLSADSGQAFGDSVVSAAHTLSLLTLKPGLYTGSGRDHCGRIWFDDLGVGDRGTPADAWLCGGPELLWPLPQRRHGQHKGDFGDVCVVGGAPGMLGATLLAARAAHAAGAGRVYVDLLDPNAPSYDTARPELMFRAGWWKGAPAQLAAATVLCGCGGGSLVRDVLPPLLGHSGRLVLDADALNAIATDSMLQAQLRLRAARELPTVLTPHPLEAARLLESTAAQVQAARLDSARRLAERFRCGIVLKGAGSIVAGPIDVPWLNPTGDAKLAGAGSGDVLAGWMAGLWAQARSASAQVAQRIAAASVFRHGLAATRATTGPLRAADLIDAMHAL